MNLLSKIINPVIFGLILISLVFYIISSLYQPLVGDDIFIKLKVNQSDNLFNYLTYNYFTWTGRFSQILLGYLVFSNEYILLILKIFTIPIFFLSIWLAWFCVNGYFIKYNNKNFNSFLIFAIVLWLSIPAVAVNIIWVTGFITWVYPMFFSICFLAINFSIFNDLQKSKHIKKHITWKLPLLIFLGFLSGSSIEQLSAITFIIIVFIFYNLLFKNKLKIPLELYIGFLFLILGIFFLILAPGNYLRMNLLEDNTIQKLFKYLLYLTSAFYYLGNIEKATTFLFSIVIIIYVFNPNLIYSKNNIRISLIWFTSSIVSLIVMFPVISFVSIRTIFYPIFFFYLFILAVNINDKSYNEKNQYIKKNIIIFILLTILLFDSFTSYLANRNFYFENMERDKLIETAINKNADEVKVPFFSTIPSRLTHIQTPKHDKEFLDALSKIKNIEISHQINDKTKLPYSTNTLKKFRDLLN